MAQQNEAQGFFTGSARDRVASAKLKDLNDQVGGVITDQYIIDYVPFGKKEPEVDARTNETVKQLVVVLQTKNAGWANVAKVPTDEEGHPLPPDKDDGKRAIYLRAGTNLWAMVGRACKAVGVNETENGGKLAVKLNELEDVNKGNLLRKFVAKYEAPKASDDFFGGDDSAPPAQVQTNSAPATSQAAPAESDPWSTSTTTAPSPSPAGSDDPWGGDEPPF